MNRYKFLLLHSFSLFGWFAFLIGQTLAQTPSFGLPVVNPFGLTATSTSGGQYFCPALVDIDDDGDLDVFVGYSDLLAPGFSSILFFENVGTPTAPNFAASTDLPFGIMSASNISVPVFVDLDDDGDQDLLLGTESPGSFRYQENIGTASSPMFSSSVQTNPFGLSVKTGFNFPTAGDLDDDGDFEVLSGEQSISLKYHPNNGNANFPIFDFEVVNPFGLSNTLTTPTAPHLVDIDLDGDLDLFVGGTDNGTVGNFYYYANTGTATSPAFGAIQTNPFQLSATGAEPVIASGDLDGDGDIDLLVGMYNTPQQGDLVFYENMGGSANQAPTLNPINSTSICEGTTLSNYPITASDPDGDNLTVTATSSNTTLLPNMAISIGGSAPNFALTATPTAGQTGTTTITVEVSDGNASVTETFDLTVTTCNSAPTISVQDSAVVCVGNPFGSISVTASDPDGDALFVIPSSDNQAVIPTGVLTVSGSAPNFTLSSTSNLSTIGTATIKLLADDGSLADSTTIFVTVTSCPSIISPSSRTEVRIFPQPASDQLTIEWPQAVTLKSVQMVDIQGRVVQSWETHTSQTDRLTLPLTGIMSGIYWLEIEGNETRWGQRVSIK